MIDTVKVRTAIAKTMWVLRETDIPRRANADLKHPNAKVTGNLKYNANRMLPRNATDTSVVMDETIAPYVPYTNEPWISPKWKGAKNPNEKWFENYVKDFATILAMELGGELIIKEE